MLSSKSDDLSVQNNRLTSDAMWAEIILSKFPQEFIQPVLMKAWGKEEITVETVLEMIQDEIATKVDVQVRLRPVHVKRKESENKKSNQIRVIQEEITFSIESRSVRQSAELVM